MSDFFWQVLIPNFRALLLAPQFLTEIVNSLAKYSGGFCTISITAPDGLDDGKVVTHM
jgi:hypothetical protein